VASDKISFELDGNVGLITLDSPPMNLFDGDVVEGLESAVGEAADSDARALIVRAEGQVFTAGVDVHVFDGLSASDAHDFAGRLIRLAQSVEALPFPTIACVHGLCLTAGFELALACDMIWAAESARFGLVEIVVGVSPFMGGTQRVAERAGPARARELVMSGGLYEAAVLERWNVVNRVLPDADLAEKTRRFAQRLADGPTRANHATKRVVRAYLDGGVKNADDDVPDIVAPLFESEDLKGGVRSFLENGPGKATFEGK
jgi:enoyl-CoA hydratase/carnithine racemase